ncbi:myc box-dependent-interacting protein 1-like isoform X5 [Eriocheir sinensis]|uniref:myc box-dependent-interacting protein 1-like isoform X5 n=1 Tax=Eriocheir sinensis TaxID=95602 RepID=UPI0021C9E699|nr:myc box-dependent-interacting protein 1-like isoform X5 [Eriocheir sinensis]
MQAVDIEEVEVECTPTPRRRSSHGTRESPPSSPDSPCPPSPSSPRPPSPSTPTSPPPDAGQEADGTPSPAAGHGGRRLPNIRLKKQCSKIFRIKTKILQNLGKADRTVDDVFDEYDSNFTRQQTNANRLHKEVSNYLRCCRALHGASKGLYETLSEIYEPEWVGHELLYAQAQNSDMLWTDFCHKLQDQTLAPLTAYQQQFPELRKKIDKRGRKLVDYDSQRHQLENLQRASRRDEYKIARSRDALETARTTYEVLNKELYEELPALYDQRIPNIANHLQTLYAAEATVMAEFSKVAKEVEAIADKLSKECNKGTYKVKRTAAPRPLSSVESSSPQNTNTPSIRPTISAPVAQNKEETGRPYEEIEFEDKKVNGNVSPPARTNGEVLPTKIPPAAGPALSNGPSFTSHMEELETKVEEIYDVPVGATTEGLPSGVLYRVRATYKYTREDVDEISFEVGEVINVVEYDDPEEQQEEGWLTGIKDGTNEKGLFPANFTRPI